MVENRFFSLFNGLFVIALFVLYKTTCIMYLCSDQIMNRIFSLQLKLARTYIYIQRTMLNFYKAWLIIMGKVCLHPRSIPKELRKANLVYSAPTWPGFYRYHVYLDRYTCFEIKIAPRHMGSDLASFAFNLNQNWLLVTYIIHLLLNYYPILTGCSTFNYLLLLLSK